MIMEDYALCYISFPVKLNQVILSEVYMCDQANAEWYAACILKYVTAICNTVYAANTQNHVITGWQRRASH